MQDISRDDLSILNGGAASAHVTDKDMCAIQIYKSQNTSSLNSSATNLPKDSNGANSDMQSSFIPAKVEDINTVDLFPSNSTSWRQYQINDLGEHRLFLNSRNAFDHNNAKLLLQGSDDPLISHGANSVVTNDDEHPADFAKSFITQANNYLQNTVNKKDNQERLSKLLNEEKTCQRPVKSGCSNLTKQQLKVKANLMSARNQQQQQQQQQQTQNTASSQNVSTVTTSNQNTQRNQKTKNKKATTVKLRFHHQALPPEYLSHYEATQGQLRMFKNQPNIKMSNQRNSLKTTNNLQRPSQPRNSHENVRSWLQKIAEIQRTANASKKNETSQAQKSTDKNQCQPNSVNKYESQISFNSISVDANNNYKMQTVSEMQNVSSLPHSSIHDGHLLAEVNNRSSSKRSNYSDLPYMGEILLDNSKPRRGRKPKKADICHLIYKNYGTILPPKTKTDNCSKYSSNLLHIKNHCFLKDATIEQPLNLCLRDQLNDSYSISSGEELSETNSTCPTPVSTTPFDYMRDSMLANNLEKSLNNINEQNDNEGALNTPQQSVLPESQEGITDTSCKKILENGVLPHNTNGRYKAIKKDNQLALKLSMPNGLFQPQKIEKPASSPVELQANNSEPLSTSSSMQTEKSVVPTKSLMQNQQLIGPQKRKRSAIFIPPMNVENSNNPATEVSICKFKFTGGSNPSLQEKKMISVDAGGNYSYFSGTGDKASRGYEYFPRESLQQTAGLLPGVNCTGRKLCIEIPSPPQGLSNDTLQMSESSTSSGRSVNISMDSNSPKTTIAPFEVSKNEACSLSIKENSSYSSSNSPTTLTENFQLKRNDAPRHQRKFSQKEKLEKTFKDQGFLIQTQQVESAEGATYCKFRQLKKLTRYLFRNWKDYLPNGIQENTNIATFTARKDTSVRANEFVHINAIKQPSTNLL